MGKAVITKFETMKTIPITKFTDVLVISNGPKTASCHFDLVLNPKRGKNETREDTKRDESMVEKTQTNYAYTNIHT